MYSYLDMPPLLPGLYSILFCSLPATQRNFIKIRPVGAELFHMEGQADGQT